MTEINLSKNNEAYLYILDQYRAGEMNLTEALIMLNNYCDMKEEVALDILTTEQRDNVIQLAK